MFNRNDENYVYELVSKNIKEIRKAKGLTQEQLAEKMDYSTQFISNSGPRAFIIGIILPVYIPLAIAA